jgi:DNA-binding Lrp family transcriptional regulator
MLEGKIERQGFLDIIQLLNMSRKTGRLEIKGETDGTLFFQEGEILDCQMDKLSGDEAFIELFIRVTGHFRFNETKVSVKQLISKSLTDLLMAASKQAAEWDAARKELPFEDAALVLTPVDPKAAEQFKLSSLGWAIISQVNGRRSFSEIARLLGQSKTNVAINVAELKKQGLITIEDEESAILRTIFRKAAQVLYHLIVNRVKPRVRERILTDFNKWTYAKGFDIRILETEGLINNIPYDMPIDDKIIAYRQTLEQMNEAALTGVNRNELYDRMGELYEQLSDKERRSVANSGFGKFLSTKKKKEGEEEFWEGASGIGSDGILPR